MKQHKIWAVVSRSAREATEDFFAPLVGAVRGAVRGVEGQYRLLDMQRRQGPGRRRERPARKNGVHG